MFLGAVAYNNWLLGPLFNDRLFSKNGSVSEYSALAQPFNWVFQSLDILSGAIIVFIGYRLWQTIERGISTRALSGGFMILGFANMVDASFVLPCSQTLNLSCQIPVSLSLTNYQVPPHAYSSVIIGLCYLLLPVLALIYSYKTRLNRLSAISLVLIASALVSLGSVLAEYSRNGGPTTKTSGGGQEIQMLLLGLWLVVCVYELTRKAQTIARATTGTAIKKPIK